MDLTLIVTYGRTGSTLLMRVLRQHPQVLVRGPFPFEARTAQYLYLAQRFGTEPLGRPLSYDGVTYHPAGNLDEMFRGIALEALKSARFPQSMLNAYSRISEAEGRSEATVIVEKALGILLPSEILDEFGNFRMIALIRDPRTTVRSIRAFNRQRGFLSFGEEAGLDVLMDRVIAFNVHALELAQAHAGHSLIVRYEDLIRQPAPVVEGLLELHGLTRDPEAIGRMLGVCGYEDDLARGHRTSGAEGAKLEDHVLSRHQADWIRQLGY